MTQAYHAELCPLCLWSLQEFNQEGCLPGISSSGLSPPFSLFPQTHPFRKTAQSIGGSSPEAANSPISVPSVILLGHKPSLWRSILPTPVYSVFKPPPPLEWPCDFFPTFLFIDCCYFAVIMCPPFWFSGLRLFIPLFSCVVNLFRLRFSSSAFCRAGSVGRCCLVWFYSGFPPFCLLWLVVLWYSSLDWHLCSHSLYNSCPCWLFRVSIVKLDVILVDLPS